MANTVDQYCDAVYRFHCCSNLLNGDHTPCSGRYDDCGYKPRGHLESQRESALGMSYCALSRERT